MSVIFSRQCEYALQAVLYLALKPAGTMISIKELTKKLGIPYHFLAKILQDLANQGLLRSMKGPTGGFTLAHPATEITLFHIVEAVDGLDFLNTCVMGFPDCSGNNPCAVHSQWGSLRDGIHSMLVHKNMADLAKEITKPEYKSS
ncbi:MAG: Rrf2 family transcriptional regulator [Ignavibacteriales bacterium]|nr:Rrf2 family transcriptional regulator [Ignavibacteriales bacterium]